jgi:hypothetical protein
MRERDRDEEVTMKRQSLLLVVMALSVLAAAGASQADGPGSKIAFTRLAEGPRATRHWTRRSG